jgi:ATP-binding cassette subfamily B protein
VFLRVLIRNKENSLDINPALLNYNLKKAVSTNRLVGLWRIMTNFHWHYTGAIVCLAISASSKTATYLLLRYFVDSVMAAKGGTDKLWLIALGFILLAMVEGGFSFLSGRLAAQTAEGVARRLRNFMYDHIQNLTFTYHSKTETGDLIQRSSSDVDAVRRFYSDQAIGIGRIFLLFGINFAMIYNLHPKLAWVSVIVVPAIVGVSFFFFRKVSKAYEKYQEQDATLSTTLQENLTGVRVVKAFARQEYEINKFDKDNSEKFKRGKRLLLMHSLFWPVSDIISSAQWIAGFLTGALMVINGDITIGTFLAYNGMFVWIIWPMRNLGRVIVNMSTGLVSYKRVMEVIKQDREPLDEGDYTPETDIKGDLIFDKVGFTYQEGNTAIEDISFHCLPGQAVALLGSTGSGKTTLVNLLPRFYEYTSGSISLDGIELKRYTRRFLRREVGIVEQEPFLFSRTIRENISYGVSREVSDEEVENAAKAAAIHDDIITFPKGYQTLLGERGVTLSGGQKQRVAIARTLLKNPRILILDDSTSSVDTETEAEIREALDNLMRDRTTFIIAHRIQSIMDADLVLVMDKGKVVQAGKHKELLTQEGIYRQIFNIQTRIEEELEMEIASVA